MFTLKPGDQLKITRRCVGLRPDPDDGSLLEFQILQPDQIVEYISPDRVIVRLEDGVMVDVHISNIEIIQKAEDE
jgi:hypothetical protein